MELIRLLLFGFSQLLGAELWNCCHLLKKKSQLKRNEKGEERVSIMGNYRAPTQVTAKEDALNP